MLTFLYGRSGSGKTTYIIERIKESVAQGRRVYLLVPEQQAFISECMLADLPPASALCFEVVSFSRLCEIVFSAVGGLVDARAGSGIRSLIMWQTLREMASVLREYKGVRTDGAFGAMMLSTVDELQANSITPTDCERASEKCADPVLSQKLHDVAVVYEGFLQELSTRLGEGALAAENKLKSLASLLQANRIFEGSEIFVDSFTSFTGEEHEVLEQLALQADLCISFCCDKDVEARRMPHTESIADTARRLNRFASRRGLQRKTVTPDTPARKKSPALTALERGLWDFSLTRETRPDLPLDQLDAIDTVVCRNEYEEAHYAALQILKAHREGVRFSEIALIMRDCESRKGILDAVFEKLGIPYFYSEKTDLSTTPAARLLFSALRCVSFNFRLADVLTLLKTGLCGIEPSDADLFEDYCYTWDINGSTFSEELWSMHPDGYTTDPLSPRAKKILLTANRVRQRLIPPLLLLKRRLAAAGGDTVASCRAIYDYLSDVGLAKSLASLAELELTAGDLRDAGETLRVYDFLISALTDVSLVLSDARITVEELSSALEIMLRNTDIGSVPAVGDYVTVGSAATLRVENVRVAILLGLCEGEFPAAYSDTGIFSENDKALMEECDLPLASRESRVTSDELFYVYRAMTKPSDRLILCTCSSRVGGGTCSPSSALNRVRFLFPRLEKKQILFDLGVVKRIANAMREGAREDSEITERLEEIREPEEEAAPTVDPIRVRNIFSDRLYLSKSSISTFAECPYKYWCKYVLELRERTVSAVSYNNSGTIIHYILEHFIDETKSEDGSLRPISDEDTVTLVNRLMDRYVRDIGCELPPSVMYTFSRLRDLALIMVKSVTDEFKASAFRIFAQEQKISDRAEGALKPIEIRVTEAEDSPTVVLGGVIDRIDCYDDEERKYLRVVDYKTGVHTYDVTKIADGQDLQLPAYLFTAALEENRGMFDTDKPIFPASALFLSANESGGEVTTERSGFILKDEALLRAASEQMDRDVLAGIYKTKDGTIKGKAAVSEEGIMEIRDTLHRTVAATAEKIYGGCAPRTPSEDACKFCFLKGTCPVAYRKK